MSKFNITQAGLASRLGKAQQSISNWINGTSEPDISSLLNIHQIFCISLDALVKIDLQKSKILTDELVEEIKRKGKVEGKVLGKVEPVSSSYLYNGNDVKNTVDDTASWAIMSQLKLIAETLSQVQVTTDLINKKLP